MRINKEKILEKLIEISCDAASTILKFYNNEIKVSVKDDGSPLTKADLASNEIILEGLKQLTPKIPIVSEEEIETAKNIFKSDTFWLVDPLDGTKEFINKNGEFTTNIALIENATPTLGVICAPSLNIIYAGIVGGSVFKKNMTDNQKTPIATQKPDDRGYIVLGSRSHGNATAMTNFLEDKKILKVIHVGSSLKFCKLAEGSAHIYPRLGPTMKWDTAAGHAILLAAGGSVRILGGSELVYNLNDLRNPYFVASYN